MMRISATIVLGAGALLLAGGPVRAEDCESTALVALPHAPGATFSAAEAVNNRAHTIVGRSGWVVPRGPISVPARWKDGEVESLDGPLVTTIGGQQVTIPMYRPGEGAVLQDTPRAFGGAVGISFLGVIAATISFESTSTTLRGSRAAIWDEAAREWKSLALPPGVLNSSAAGMNEVGHVVGNAGVPRVWSDGVAHVLPRPSNTGSCIAFGINTFGDVAGHCLKPRTEYPAATVAVTWRTVAYPNRVPTILDGHGWNDSARTINDWGLVGGLSRTSAPTGGPWPGEAVTWAWDEIPEVHVVDDPGAILGTNNRNDRVGYRGVLGAESEAAFWAAETDEAVTYPPLCGDREAWFQGVTFDGLAVGSSRGTTTTAVYTQLVQPPLACEGTELVQLPHAWGASDSDAHAVNESGTIVGTSGWQVHWVPEDREHEKRIFMPARWEHDEVDSLDGPLVTVIDGDEVEIPMYEALEGDPPWSGERRAYGYAVGINASGVIAGQILFESLFHPNALGRAAIWDEAERKWRSLELPPGSDESSARGINDDGHVAGSTAGRATVWRDGVPHLLPLPDGTESCFAHAINNDGAVAGYCSSPDATVPVVWLDGEPLVLEGSGSESHARAINDAGLVVGRTASPATAVAWARRERPASRELGSPGAAYGVNNLGEVVGSLSVDGETSPAAFWPSRSKAPVTYVAPCGYQDGWFRAINNRGIMVGASVMIPSPMSNGGSVAVYARRP